MTNIYTTTALAISNYLQTNLTDPFTTPRTRWVYIRFQKSPPSYPIVVVNLVTSITEEGGLGRKIDVGNGNIKKMFYNIHVIVKKDNIPTGNTISNTKLLDTILNDIDYQMDNILGNISNIRNYFQTGMSSVIETDQTFEVYLSYEIQMSNIIV